MLTRGMHFLLDTNIVIPAEPTSAEDIEPTTSAIVALLGALSEGGHTAFVHPASIDEIRGDRNGERAQMRGLLIGKYTALPHPPDMSSRLVAALGAPALGSHSAVDLLLLS